jgi:exosortase
MAVLAGVIEDLAPDGRRIADFWMPPMFDTLKADQLLKRAAQHGESTTPTDRGTTWLQAGILAALVGYVYYGTLWRLVLDWWTDPNFSHGFFVPAFSALVVWQKRGELRALPRNPSWFGLLIMAGALSILVVGVLGAEFFLSRSSFVFLLAGLVIYFLGWSAFRIVLFPWACLFLMIPIPTIIFNQIAFPLQLLASSFASSVLTIVGVPVLQEGNILQLPAMSLEVAQACSGIRSLVSLGTLSVIYGYFLEPSTFRRIVLLAAAIPIAIVANGMRVVGTGLLVHYWDPGKAEGFFHTFEGWVIFVLSLGLLFSIHGLMSLPAQWRKARHD